MSSGIDLVAVFMAVLIPIMAIAMPILAIALIGAMILFGIRIIKGKSESRSLSAEESRVMQAMRRNLERMEKRISALETIILESEAKGGERE